MFKKLIFSVLILFVFVSNHSFAQENSEELSNKIKKILITLPHYNVGDGEVIISDNLNPEYGGFIINGWTDGAPSMVNDINAVCKLKKAQPNSIMFIDQEGGFAQRYKDLKMIGANKAINMSEADYKDHILKHSKILKQRCIDVNLAPVLNISRNKPVKHSHPRKIDEKRSYSTQPEIINKYAKAFVSATYAADLIPTAKHFPGDIMIDKVAFDSPYINKKKGFRWEVNNINTDYDLKKNLDLFFFDGPQFIMWSNNIFDKYSDKPAFMVEEFKSWLKTKKCNCLIITDALGELEVSDEITLKAFQNADMVMTYGNPQQFIEKIKEFIYDGTIEIQELDNKIAKIKKFKNQSGIK